MSRRKRIVLSGGTGFLGSHLSRALVTLGHDVIVIKRQTSDTSRIADLLPHIRMIDIDGRSVDAAFIGEHIDVVIHTACSYGRNGENFAEILDTNLSFAAHLLEAAVRFNTDTFINTDTALSKHLNAYALSKRQFVEWLQNQSDVLRIVNFRLEHMYGPHDDSKKFVPWLLNQLIDNVEAISLTPGEQERDFVHVEDVVKAYLHFVDREEGEGFQSYDIGSGQLVKLKDFVVSAKQAVQDVTQRSISTELEFGELPYRKGEIMKPTIDLHHIQEAGWAPEVQIDTGLKTVIESMITAREMNS